MSYQGSVGDLLVVESLQDGIYARQTFSPAYINDKKSYRRYLGSSFEMYRVENAPSTAPEPRPFLAWIPIQRVITQSDSINTAGLWFVVRGQQM